MNRQPSLTLAYLTHAPESAAGVLEALDAADAAAFLDDIPVRHAAQVLGHMSAWSGARCLELVSEQRVAAVLQQLGFHDGASLLRLMSARKRELLCQELPARRARRFRRVLEYPGGTVGAWIDADVPAFSPHASVADALHYVRSSRRASHVFLQADASGRYSGAVSIANLLQSDPAARLDSLPLERTRPLSSRAALASARAHEGWDEFLTLPVVAQNKALVGGLSRAALRQGLRQRRHSGSAPGASLAAQMLAAFGTTCAGVLRLAVTPRPSVGTAGKEDRKHG